MWLYCKFPPPCSRFKLILRRPEGGNDWPGRAKMAIRLCPLQHSLKLKMTLRKTVRENSLQERALQDPETEGSSIAVSSSPLLIVATFPENPGAEARDRAG